MSSPKEGYVVRPVAKALLVLDWIVRQGYEVSLTEVSNGLELPKTTTFRYLQTLSKMGFVQHDIYRDRYSVGDKFRDLSALDQCFDRLRQCSRPEMNRLAELFGHTINLGVVSRAWVTYHEVQPKGRSASSAVRVGHRHPVYSTALGKAVAAYMPQPDLNQLFEVDFAPRTLRTLTDVRAFKRHLSDTRRQGFSVEIGENEDGEMCIAVPILNPQGLPIAALSVSGAEARMRAEGRAEAANALRHAAARIAGQLFAARSMQYWPVARSG